MTTTPRLVAASTAATPASPSTLGGLLAVCSSTPAARLTLPMDRQAPGAARRFLAEAHCVEHSASVLDEAQLLVSELVTNAVEHGSPPVTTEVSCHECTGMRVRVTDGSPVAPESRDAAPDDESGRGMTLVDLLSDDWGVEPTEDGKSVWFCLG